MVDETTVNLDTENRPTAPSQGVMSSSELNADENRAERLQAIFGDPELGNQILRL